MGWRNAPSIRNAGERARHLTVPQLLRRPGCPRLGRPAGGGRLGQEARQQRAAV